MARFNCVTVLAPAKLNLALDVVGLLPGGYHDLDMTMQAITLYERVVLRRSPYLNLRLPGSLVAPNNKNTAIKAALAFFDYTGLLAGVDITIYKNTPVRAGMAGGSADAAAVLVGMNRLFGLGLSEAQLEEVAGRLGSDIPYCIRRGTVLCEGVGEVMTNVAHPCPDCYVVLAKLPVSVSTASVYKQLRWQEIEQHPDTKAMLKAMEEKDVAKMGKLLSNVLETVTIELHPRIAKIKARLMELGAEGALMSGSGPTVFALFTDRAKARKAAALVKREFALKDCLATRTYRVRRELRGEHNNDRNKIQHQYK